MSVNPAESLGFRHSPDASVNRFVRGSSPRGGVFSCAVFRELAISRGFRQSSQTQYHSLRLLGQGCAPRLVQLVHSPPRNGRPLLAEREGGDPVPTFESFGQSFLVPS